MLPQKTINRIITENLSSFRTLEEFEKTGKVITKKRMNFTIDRELAKRFRDYCKDKGENMSSKIEECIKKMIT